MADDFGVTDASIDPNEMLKADLIIYGIKFQWDKKDALIHMLGLQAATSTTETMTQTAVNLKQGTVHGPGAVNETFVVDSYWRMLDDEIFYGLKRAVRDKVRVGIFRFDFNKKRDDPANPGKFIVPGTYGMAYPNGVPQTEAVNNLLHSNITYNIDGNSQEGVTSQDEMEPMLYQSGLKLYDYAHNTDIGGTMDPEPLPMDKYLAAHGKATTTPTAQPAQPK